MQAGDENVVRDGSRRGFLRRAAAAAAGAAAVPLVVSQRALAATVTTFEALRIASVDSSANLLRVAANHAMPPGTSTGGAILLENSGNSGPGVVVYSNHPGPGNGRLLNVRADHPGFDAAAVHVDYDGKANAVEIVSATNDASSNALSVVSTNTQDTTVGIRGRETGRGTLKVTHEKPATSDANAAAISIKLDGAADGTAAQGIFMDTDVAPSGAGTTGRLLNLRNAGRQRFVVTAAGKALATGGIGVGNSAPASRPGKLVRRIEVFDDLGKSLGFVPVYASIA